MALILALLAGLAAPARATGDDPRWQAAHTRMQARDPAGALPHLESLVADHPGLAVYRMELAYALFLLQQDGRARHHFELARGAELTPEQARAVAHYLDEIQRRKSWSVRLGLNIVPATNAGRGTDTASVPVGELIVPVPDTARSRASTGLVVTAGATYLPGVAPALRGLFALDTRIEHHSARHLREMLFVGRAGLRWFPAENRQLDAGVILGREYQGGQHYSDRKGAFVTLTGILGPRAIGSVHLEGYSAVHPGFGLADGPRTQVQVAYQYALGNRTQLRASAFSLRTNARGPLQAGWLHGLGVGVTYAFDGGLVAAFDVTGRRETRDGAGAFFGRARRDNALLLQAEFYDTDYKIGRFLPVLRLGYEKNRSNIPLNSYSNSSISLGLRTVF